jgi:hypothetical protein
MITSLPMNNLAARIVLWNPWVPFYPYLPKAQGARTELSNSAVTKFETKEAAGKVVHLKGDVSSIVGETMCCIGKCVATGNWWRDYVSIHDKSISRL